MGAFWKITFGLLLAGATWATPAFAEKRVALVIGNSAYQKVARLLNPANDATAIAAMFKSAGFDLVETRFNAGANDLRRTLREFGNKTRDADIAVIFYAGHGIELNGNNYLIPVDATLESDADVLDETVPLDRVLFAVEPARQLRLIILDACRDNPFAKTMKRTTATRAVGRGLAKVEPTSPNTMIAFAAKAGSTASDGDSRTSPFAAALVEHLPKPGLDLRRAFGFVRDDVLKNTGNRQEPYVYGSLGGNDVPLVPAKPVASGPQSNPQEAIRRDYELALQVGTREVWSAFLAQYPDGFYASLAKGQLSRIAAEEVRAAAAEKARLAEEEKVRLAAERAKKAAQERAAAAAKLAEDARVAAEKAKQIEDDRAAAAEQRRKDAEAAAAKEPAEKRTAEEARAAAAEKARPVEEEQVRLTAEQKVYETEAAAAKAAAETKSVDATANPSLQAQTGSENEQKVVTLAVPQAWPVLSQQEIVGLAQSELRRVGCLGASPGGNRNVAFQNALALFNKHAQTKFDAKLVNLELIDAIKAKQGRVCPLVCERGFKADGEKCVKIVCRPGYRIDDNNECDRAPDRKPAAKRDDAKVRDAERKVNEAVPTKPQAGGQIICYNGGCRPVRKGCRLEVVSLGASCVTVRNLGTNGIVEVCN